MKVSLVYTPDEIHPDVISWLTSGWKGNSEDIIPFLKHLAALKQGIILKGEYLIVVEKGSVLTPDFQKHIGEIIPKIPPDFTTCLLSHYITSWKDIKFIDNTDKQLCTVTDNVKNSFAYLIRSSHAERLLAIYDKPLRNIASFNLTPEKISRLGHVCMVNKPLIARLDQSPYKEYFGHYGFSTI